MQMKTFKNDAFSTTAEAKAYAMDNTARVTTARSLFAPVEQAPQFKPQALAFA